MMKLEFTGRYHRHVTRDSKNKKVYGEIIRIGKDMRLCPIYKKVHVDNSRYTGEILRELRKQQGV